ncbi:OpgC domain-containing protein [Nocardioides lijunqiniae]|uniref:OpgC domain-containing protein n=1 Tax=Nocardioides lijunqiniae TaxID=2760832 RepID=UPI0018787A58
MPARLVRLTVGLVLSLLLLGPIGPATAADDADPVPALPTPGQPWFGPGLDWEDDLPADYAGRLGETPSLYAQHVDYPLTEASTEYLEQFAEQSATQGAVAVLSLEPQVPLEELTVSDATDLAELLDELHVRLDSYFLVRFAPEMNGSWVSWGQQPLPYVAAFRAVADAVHAATDHAAMVWAPVYGSGYPFGTAFGAVDQGADGQSGALDTDDDGDVDAADDPYGPYFPGDEAVDWVGLTQYHFGAEYDAPGFDTDGVGPDQEDPAFSINTRPRADELQSRLEETWGYGDERRRTSFYDRFAAADDRPLLLETAALWTAGDRGDAEAAIKPEWWRQVLTAVDEYPLIAGVSWLETARPEAEAEGLEVEWGATRTDALAAALRRDLVSAEIDLGPVTEVLDQQAANEATAQGRMPPPSDLTRSMDWIVGGVAVLALVFLLSGVAARLRPGWRYPDETTGSRDLRVDLFRGFLICTVIVTHTEVAGALSWFTLNAFGAVSGAEAFVALSGVVLGMVHRGQAERLGDWAASVLRWRRARTLYVTALAVVLLVYLLGLVPGIDARGITTFTDRGTGADGVEAAGRVYDLYVNAPRLLDYPPPWYAVRELLTLRMGPWVLNVLGLFVVLIALAPALLLLLRRGLWWVALAVSWAAYAYGAVNGGHVLPSQFDDVFPLLTWQVVFVNGMVLGYHRRRVIQVLSSRPGTIACTVLVVGYALVLGWLWAAHAGHLPSGPWPDDLYPRLYDDHYVRVFLQAGRLADLALVIVVVFAFLTAFWRPVNATVGRVLVPLGQASLYVFVMHVFFVLAVDNVPGLDRTSAWQGILVHVVEIALAWVLVKREVLFSVIPR